MRGLTRLTLKAFRIQLDTMGKVRYMWNKWKMDYGRLLTSEEMIGKRIVWVEEYNRICESILFRLIAATVRSINAQYMSIHTILI